MTPSVSLSLIPVFKRQCHCNNFLSWQQRTTPPTTCPPGTEKVEEHRHPDRSWSRPRSHQSQRVLGGSDQDPSLDTSLQRFFRNNYRRGKTPQAEPEHAGRITCPIWPEDGLGSHRRSWRTLLSHKSGRKERRASIFKWNCFVPVRLKTADNKFRFQIIRSYFKFTVILFSAFFNF